ncbi:hypothetical protein QYE76_031420 [Lolium multiflorum]|uniref:Uncharacterized protein n=1 Tax=Lolium multiflorum TaxID=4521 RepID=A0AAD8QS47_LOLMU|nr:hypothetical protein QYE76_031420 [Lolium multiflorum]
MGKFPPEGEIDAIAIVIELDIISIIIVIIFTIYTAITTAASRHRCNDLGGQRQRRLVDDILPGEVRRRDAQHRQPRRRPQQLEREGRALFWGVPGRTLDNVIRGIRNGAPRLEMPSSPPPSPQWQPRRTTYSSSSHSSSSGPTRSTPSSSYRSAPYTIPRREVKEEPATPVNTRRGGSGSGSGRQRQRRQQGRRGGALLIPKPEVKEEPEEVSKAALLAEYERKQRLIASSDDPEDCPGLRAAFLASMDDKDAWRGDLDAAIAMSIRDSGKPLVDLTDDGEAGPSGLVKDEPVDERVKGGRHRRHVQLPAALRRLRPPQVVLD